MSYRDDFRGYEREAYWTLPKVAIWILVAGAVLSVVGMALGWIGSATTVVNKEFSPEAMLAKYSWFKDASAALDKKISDITVYESRLKGIKTDYGNAPRSKWTREDREQYNIWLSELAGIKASYNQVAAEYNAQMAKFNWRFANAGELPHGADRPLPREYRAYVTE